MFAVAAGPAVVDTVNPLTDVGDQFTRLYPRLRRMAHAQLRRNEPITLLDTTALVHESYLRMSRGGALGVAEPGHFMGYASRVMRFVIVDFVRRRRAERRGGGQLHVTLGTGVGDSPVLDEQRLVDLHDALEQLAGIDDRLVRVVEMRCFGGMAELEIAAALGVTDRTVRRDWHKAKAMLRAAMGEDEHGADANAAG